MSSRSKATTFFRTTFLNHWNVTNISLTDTPYYRAKFTFPGLSHESFDRDGNPKITSLMMTSVFARGFILNKPLTDSGDTFLDWKIITEDRFTFVSSTHFKMSKQLYNADIPKWPLDVDVSLAYVGNSSMASITSFYNSGDTSEPLWSQVNQVVCVDKVTRKPIPFPDWYKDKYKEKCCMDKGLIIKPFQRPTKTYCMPVVVRWSDTDGYNHTNFASYVHWVVNAIHASLSEQSAEVAKDESSSSAMPLISKEIITNGLKDIQICYLSESLENQSLDVHIWQQDQENHKVYAAIERGKDDICQMQLEYFDIAAE
ncbi:hypothetical protein BgiMline_026392 [Biomphalaria glabrata]|nr:sulfur dioxygenase [Biomphalaria glabrata]KAI8767403.1 sulfur dioxygenase [Biomphalaria glabrata]